MGVPSAFVAGVVASSLALGSCADKDSGAPPQVPNAVTASAAIVPPAAAQTAGRVD